MDTPSWEQRIRDWLWSLRDNRTKQAWVMGGVAAGLIVLISIGVAIWHEPSQPTVNTAKTNPTGAVVASHQRVIDGVTVQTGQENLYPVAFMIENLSAIRPQSGLQSANVVYEALAEGGITRFMAVYTNYQDNNINLSKIGPIRSARPYFVQLAEEYNALYGHAGGSPQAIDAINASQSLIDFTQMYADSVYYYRDEAIAAPHNLFTTAQLLTLALRDKKLEGRSGSFTPWTFTSESQNTSISTIDIPYYSEEYAVQYVYDRLTTTYRRFNGGVAHTDALTGDQITVTNIVVQFCPTGLLDETSGRMDISVVGSGRAIVFRDGQAIEGTWNKADGASRTTFTDTTGQPIAFIPGNIWINLVPDDNAVTYQ